MSSVLTHEQSTLLESVKQKYPERLSPYVRQLISEGRYSSEALHQYVASTEELHDDISYSSDACNEGLYRRGKAIIHKYPNRVAMVLTNICFVYCRFCFRKAIVGQPDSVVRRSDMEEALEYIRANTDVIDVLLTGGDPMALGNGKLKAVIDGLTAIPHVKVIRIDSRALNTAPERFDDHCLDILESSGKVWYHAHLNHPEDLLQPEVLKALNRLQKRNIPVLNQFVLLNGVNNNPETIKHLLLSCYTNKIIPYNIYLPDRVTGTSHFRVEKSVIREIFELIGTLPGPAQPALVIVDTNNLKQRALSNPYLDLDGFLESYYDKKKVRS